MKEIIIKQKQILLFILAGGLSAVVEIGLFKLGSVYLPKIFPSELNFYGIKYPLSNVLSTLCAILFNYVLSICFVFEQGKHSKKKEFLYFMIVSSISTMLSLSLFQLFFHYVFLENVSISLFVFSPEVLSKIFAIIVVSILNYSVKKKIIFNG
ncbi:GtrA family protein [Halpernia sp.]|uniref:GtrA family protein n=1 Tax=Halpernia sp. TaxID=2782209 RepID=UPI003A92427E